MRIEFEWNFTGAELAACVAAAVSALLIVLALL